MSWIERFLGFKLDIGRFYILIKDNIALIVIIPSVLGGLEQLLRLFMIEPEMVRFFSISQVIPDGLAIILLTIILFCLFYIWIRSFFTILKICEKLKVHVFGLFVIGLSLLLLLIGVEIHIMNNYVFINTFRNFSKEFNLINIFFALCIAPVGITLLYLLPDLNKRMSNFHFLFTSKNVGKMALISLLTAVLLFPPIYNYNYLLNFSFLKSDIKETFKDLKGLEDINIKYVNDKYVIVELKSKDYCNCGKAYLYKVYLLEDIIKGDFNK